MLDGEVNTQARVDVFVSVMLNQGPPRWGFPSDKLVYGFINVYTCLEMFIHVYKCLYMFINVYRCF
jgi:hypothetical protein